MKIVLSIITVLVFVSCANSGTKQKESTIKIEAKSKEENKLEDKKEAVQTPVVKFEILHTSGKIIPDLKNKGKTVYQKFWKDANGENVVLFINNETELYAYHYVFTTKGEKLLRKVYDFIKDCEFDMFFNFVEDSITVTDLDQNDIGEITFAYRKACVSDVSPIGLKLLVLENGNKYIIRGNSITDLGEFKIGGEKNVDTSFNNAPEKFLKHANAVWLKVVEMKY